MTVSPGGSPPSATPSATPAAVAEISGLASRQAAWQVLLAVAAGAWADAAMERELNRRPLSAADRALVTELAYGAIRQRRLLDAWLDAHGRVRAEQQPPKLRWLLHVGLYQLLFSARVPASAAVSTTVELAKRGGLGRLAPVVNGLLRAVLRRREREVAGAGPAGLVALEPWQGLELPLDPAAAFGLRHSLPNWLASALFQWLPPEQAEAFGRAANAPPPLDLRRQQLRCQPETLAAAFAAAAVRIAPLPGLDAGLTLLDRPGALRQLPGYEEGWWSVQDRSAQRIVGLLDPQPGERVLDACAAPGGKATQIAERMADRGEIWAVDRSESRLRRVAANAERLGLSSIRVLAADAARLVVERPDWGARFDRILLDAPCSGLGTLARHADARWRITPATVEELAAQQDQLLAAMLPLLAPGGWLLYATCTVHPRENGERIAALLRGHPDWQLQRESQWWPGQEGGGDGFYAALLRAPELR